MTGTPESLNPPAVDPDYTRALAEADRMLAEADRILDTIIKDVKGQGAIDRSEIWAYVMHTMNWNTWSAVAPGISIEYQFEKVLSILGAAVARTMSPNTCREPGCPCDD